MSLHHPVSHNGVETREPQTKTCSIHFLSSGHEYCMCTRVHRRIRVPLFSQVIRCTQSPALDTRLHQNSLLGRNNDAAVWALGLLREEEAAAARLTFREPVRVVSIYPVTGQHHPAFNADEQTHICIRTHAKTFPHYSGDARTFKLPFTNIPFHPNRWCLD